MKATIKLLCATLFLIASVLWVPQESWALPSRCDELCSYPKTCGSACLYPDSDVWMTCYEYFGGSCSPAS